LEKSDILIARQSETKYNSGHNMLGELCQISPSGTSMKSSILPLEREKG